MAEQAQANPQGLMPIGVVAAANIAAFLNLDVKHIGTIEQAIKDEINAMSSHFTLAFADVQTQYEVDVAKLKAEVDVIKSTYTYVKANAKKLIAFFVGVYVLGFVTGWLV